MTRRKNRQRRETQLSLPLRQLASTERSDVSRAEGIEFGQYVVYVDESGHHPLKKYEDRYPVFCLAFCVFHKGHYCREVIPRLQRFKFKYFGHDQVNLHESEIRKRKPPFNFFKSKDEHESFMASLGAIVKRCNFILISCVIDKRRVNARDAETTNAYRIGLQHCMETLYDFLCEKSEQNKLTYVVVEGRGKDMDHGLELEFRRICDGQNRHRIRYMFDIKIITKSALSSGLQLADLVARPIGLAVFNPEQSIKNRAFEALKKKFYCEGGRSRVGKGYHGWGLKIYPSPDSPKPRP